MKICPLGAELFPANGRTDGGQTDRQTGGRRDSYEEANIHSSKFCEHAYKLQV
jgi:hypothetical protein